LLLALCIPAYDLGRKHIPSFFRFVPKVAGRGVLLALDRLHSGVIGDCVAWLSLGMGALILAVLWLQPGSVEPSVWTQPLRRPRHEIGRLHPSLCPAGTGGVGIVTVTDQSISSPFAKPAAVDRVSARSSTKCSRSPGVTGLAVGNTTINLWIAAPCDRVPTGNSLRF
jgi:hypothetical protein